MGAILTPKTFNAHAICDGSIYRAKFLASSPIGESYSASPTMVQLPGGYQKTAGMDYGARTIPLLVQLLTPTQAYREQLYKWFAPQDDEVWLIATDESSVDRRIAVRCLRLLPYENWKNAFVAILQADSPLWEKDTVTTSEHLHCAGDSHVITLVNNGSAPAKPVITVKFNAAKKQAGGPAYFLHRNLINTCVNALDDPDGEGWPTLVKSGLNTATLVKNTAIYNLINGAIDASVTTINIDGAVGGGLPTGSGMAMVGTEQIYYAANSGTQLTGCIRGIGGTTTATHADDDPIYASKALANGNDFRVWVDGCEVDRWFGTGSTAWNQATTKTWANIPWKAGRHSHLKDEVTASVPADGGSIEFTTDISTWPDAGFLTVVETVPEEVISYSSHTDRAVLGIKRAQRGTTTGYAPYSAGTLVYVNEHDIRYSYGDAGAGSPPSDSDLKPMIDLALSTNALWCWPAAYRAEGTRRTAQWQQGYENVNALCAKLRAFEASSKMQVEDALPEAGKPNRNTWSIANPAGIAGASEIHHDVLVPANMLLQVWGDDGAALNLLKEYNSANDGDGEVITPAAAIYGLQYRALVRTVTANTATGDGDRSFGTASPYYEAIGVKFTLAARASLVGAIIPLKKFTSGTGSLRVGIWTLNSSGYPDQEVTNYGTIDVAGLTTSYVDTYVAFAQGVTLPAGEYGLVITASGLGGANPTAAWEVTSWRSYAGGHLYKISGSTWLAGDAFGHPFMLLGDGTVCQPEVPTATGEECTVDDIELILNSALPTPVATAEKSCYLWEALLTLTHADATVQTLSLLVPAEVGQEMEIDCAAQTVINKTTGESVAFGLTASDKGWLDILSATDSLTYAEIGMTDTDVTVVLRDTYAA